MFRLTHRSKTIGYYSTAMDALYKFIEEEEERIHATDLIFCGTDREAYFEVFEEEPPKGLTEDCFIIIDGDSITLVESRDPYDIMRGLYRVNEDWDIIEEDDDEEEEDDD